MTPEQRTFVDGLLDRARTVVPAAERHRSAEVRQFVDALLHLATPPTASAPTASAQRAFVDQFVRLAADVLPAASAEEVFASTVMGRWKEITWRARGAVDERIAQLSMEQHHLIQVLERTPSLLAPLRQTRDETSHSELLGWALRLGGPLGAQLRDAWLKLVGRHDAPTTGWLVRNERVLDARSRVDVDIVIPGHWRCMIEMKVDAHEGDHQLLRYRAHLDTHARDFEVDTTLVFLTVHAQSEQHPAKPTPLTFGQLLAAWLPLALGPGPDAQVLRMWLVPVARDLCEVAAEGPSATWPFSRRVALLDFLEESSAAATDALGMPVDHPGSNVSDVAEVPAAREASHE